MDRAATRTVTGRILTPEGWTGGTLSFRERIEVVAQGNAAGPYIVPGFIDVHVHGGGGGDTMDGADGVRTLARFHARHGTTSLLATTITNPWERVMRALEGVRDAMSEVEPVEVESAARVVGAHLEGPFLNPGRLGAQPPNALEPTAELVREVLGLGVVRVVTIAPEVNGALEAGRRFAAAGVRTSVGHTRASFEEVAAFAAGVREAGGVVGSTHLYNAMGGLSGRDPGAVGAALADTEAFAELILDGHHVHEGAFRVAYAAKRDRLLLVTDAIRAAGLGEGRTELGGQAVTVEAGAARLADGTLAGSVLTLDGALRNAVRAGVPLEHAVRMLSAVPARYLGLADRGEIRTGLLADLVMLDDDLEVLEVIVGGVRVA